MYDTATLRHLFQQRYGAGDTLTYCAPGRVNLIGEHIDYNGGFVLPATLSLGITAVVRRRDDAIVRIFANDFGEEAILDIDTLSAAGIDQSAVRWPDYITATLLVLKERGAALRGADIVMGSDLPLGAGLSSSAALECLIAFMFDEPYYTEHRTSLALDAQRAEREYVGVNCGIMDQFAVANGRENQAILLNCATLEFDYVPADFRDYQLIIINSNKSRALAESKYNERRSECDRAFALLRQWDVAEDLCHVHEISLGYLEDDVLYSRAKHAVLENKRVLQAVDALRKGEMEAFGQLLTDSHRSLDADYEVSGHELNMIVHYSTHFEGCIGARMTGAGFGGCCIALVEKEKVQRFMTYVGKKYTEKTALTADFYRAEIGGGVRRVSSL